MSFLIEHIDVIACRLQHDVVMVTLMPPKTNDSSKKSIFPRIDWKNHPGRKAVIDWLDKRKIKWSPCGRMEVENFLPAYNGEIFIDIRYDPESPSYSELVNFLEDGNGTTRIPEIQFCYLTLDLAIHNQGQINPNWIDSF